MRQAKREAILLTASRLFNAKGIETTSLDEIAAAMGTNKRALYRYVGDKQEIVTACYERAFRIAFFISDQIDALGLSAGQQLDAQQRGHALAQQNRDICPLRQDSGLGALSAEARTLVVELASRFTELGRQRFCAAQRAGEVRPLAVEDFLFIAASPSAWLAKPLAPATPARQLEIADAIADFVRLGLSPLPTGEA